MHALAHFIYQQFVLGYAIRQKYYISPDCEQVIIQQLSEHLVDSQTSPVSYAVWEKLLVESPGLKTVPAGCRKMVNEMIRMVEESGNPGVLFESSFRMAKDKICPSYPFF